MSTVKSRREQYSQATRAAILDAAMRRFAELGFSGTALEDVAADIQATRGAVYHHFTNKQALFEAVLEQLETEAVERSAAAADAAPDTWSGAFAALEVFLDCCCDPVYGKVVWHEGPLALGWHRWRECEEKYAYGLISRVVGTLMDEGILERQPLEPATRITFSMLSAAGLALAETSEVDKPRVRDEYRTLISRLMYGLRAGTLG